MQTLVFLRLRGTGLHMREIAITRVYFLTLPRFFLLPCAPFDGFLWLMAQKTCFRVIYILFGVRTKIFNISTIFCKNREILAV